MVKRTKIAVSTALFTICALVLFGVVALCRICGRQYVAKCEFECAVSEDGAGSLRSVAERAWLVGGYLNRFVHECPTETWTEGLICRFPDLVEVDRCAISNAISSCAFVQPDGQSSRILIAATSKDRGLAHKVVVFGVERFSRWLAMRNEAVERKNVSRLRAELERARRSGEVVAELEENVATALSRINGDSFRVRVIRPAYVEYAPR